MPRSGVHVLPGIVGDAQPADRSAFFHAAGEVDGHAHHAVIGLDAASKQHLAGVDTCANRETRQSIVALDLLGVDPGIREQRQSGAYGAFGVVFATDVGTERG